MRHYATATFACATTLSLLLGAPTPQRALASVTCGDVNMVASANGGRVLDASSEAREGRRGAKPEWRKENLIDGLAVADGIVPAGSYGWATEVAPSLREPAWAVLAFAQDRPRLIGAVCLDPRTHDPQVIGRWVRNFSIEVSLTTPKGPWQNVGSFELVNTPHRQSFKFEEPVQAKYVRLLINSNHGSNARASLGEFEVYEALLPDDELTQIIATVEQQLARLRRLALVKDGAPTSSGPPPLQASLLAAANGGEVLFASSEDADEAGNVRPQWRKENLIDGLTASPDGEAAHESHGWSSARGPSRDQAEVVIFRLPTEHAVVVDTSIVDTTTRDPWGMGRGLHEMELLVATESQDGPWRSLGTWQFPIEPHRHVLEFAPVEARFVKLRLISNFGSDRCVELGEFGIYRLSEETGVLEGIAYRLEASTRELKRYREGELRPAERVSGHDG